MNLCIVKLNGFPDSFNERLRELSKHVNKIFLIRGKCEKKINFTNVYTYDLFPNRPNVLAQEGIISALKLYLYLMIYFVQAFIILFNLSRKEKIDIIHCFDYPIDSFASLPSRFFWGTPVVISLRGLSLIKGKGNIFSKVILRKLSRMSIKNADYIFFKSEYQPFFVNDTLNVSLPPYSIIPTGVDLKLLNTDHYTQEESISTLSENFEFSKETIKHYNIFTYIGKFVKIKGADLLKEYIIKLKNSKSLFMFVGANQERLGLNQLIKENNNALVLGSVPFTLIPHILNISDAIILLSEDKTEGAPRVLQESLAMGTPIIASNVCGIKEEFGDIQGAILIDRESFTEFKDAIEIIKNNNITVDGDKVKNRFNIEKNYEKYGEIYNNLISIR